MNTLDSPASSEGPADPQNEASASFDSVDLGSWARFTPSLARFLDQCRRQVGDGRQGCTVLLTAPAPIVTEQSVGHRTGLRGLVGRRRTRTASPEVPGVVLVVAHDVELSLPVVDAQDRVLLDEGATRALEALGWRRDEDLMRRRLPEGQTAAEALQRVLIEILQVPHPADLDHLAVPPQQDPD